jgi:hypothetical protein
MHLGTHNAYIHMHTHALHTYAHTYIIFILDTSMVGCESMNWIDLNDDTVKWKVLLTVVMNFKAP